MYAGRFDFAIANLTVLILGNIMGDFDALDTKRAFFHNTLAAHGDIRIELQVEWFRPLPGKPVKAPHFIGAVLHTVAGPDTAVVDLVIETFLGVMRGIDWTDTFAGGIVTMLTHHG